MEKQCDDVSVSLSRFDIWPRSYPELRVEVNRRWRLERRMSVQDIFGVVISAKCCDFYTQREALCYQCKGPGGKLLRVLIKEHVPSASESGVSDVFQFTIKQFCSSPKTHININDLVLLMDFGGGNVASTKKFRLVARDYRKKSAGSHKVPRPLMDSSDIQSQCKTRSSLQPVGAPKVYDEPTEHPPTICTSQTSSLSLPLAPLSHNSPPPPLCLSAPIPASISSTPPPLSLSGSSPLHPCHSTVKCDSTPSPEASTSPQLDSDRFQNLLSEKCPPVVVRILHSNQSDATTKLLMQSATTLSEHTHLCLKHMSVQYVGADAISPQPGHDSGRIAITVTSYKSVLDALEPLSDLPCIIHKLVIRQVSF
ncbi:hypothetical protein Pelo_10553 [Pelomyxa schiedti]|nr:hypothetical protein Pelo_10553 [Pelomyxa schiedti]